MGSCAEKQSVDCWCFIGTCWCRCPPQCSAVFFCFFLLFLNYSLGCSCFPGSFRGGACLHVTQINALFSQIHAPFATNIVVLGILFKKTLTRNASIYTEHPTVFPGRGRQCSILPCIDAFKYSLLVVVRTFGHFFANGRRS